MTRFLFAVLMLCLVACGDGEQRFDTEDYEKTRERLEEKEKKSPRQFLEVASSDKRNWIGQRVIRGTVTNKASVASYKDIELKIRFYSKTGVLLQENKEMVYELLAPKASTKFKSRDFAPKGTDSITITVVSAKPGE